MPDSVVSKSGHNYTLTVTSSSVLGRSNLNKENISIAKVNGEDGIDVPGVSETFYDLSTNALTITLTPQDSYEKSYNVTVGGTTYNNVPTTEIKPCVIDTVSIKNISYDENINTVTVNVYNPKMVSVNVSVKQNGAVKETTEISAEAVKEVEIENIEVFNEAEWTVE